MRVSLNLYRTMQRGLVDAKADAPVRRVRSLISPRGAGAGLCTDPPRGCRQGWAPRQERQRSFPFFFFLFLVWMWFPPRRRTMLQAEAIHITSF